MNNSGSDAYHWNPESKTVSVGADGFKEVNLFPQGTGSPGNRGTVDIGSSNNSTAAIAQQILYGISPADLAFHGGKLEFDSNGQLFLNGDTGISAGVKDELASIIGKPRIIPIFSSFTAMMRMPCHLTIVYLALLPLPLTLEKIGMIRGWPMIDASSSFTPALMPVSPLRYSLPLESNSSLPP